MQSQRLIDKIKDGDEMRELTSVMILAGVVDDVLNEYLPDELALNILREITVEFLDRLEKRGR